MTDEDDKNFNVMLPHYSGNPVGHNGEGLSCDQFCEIVDNSVEQFKWTDHDAYSYAIQAFTSPANEFDLTGELSVSRIFFISISRIFFIFNFTNFFSNAHVQFHENIVKFQFSRIFVFAFQTSNLAIFFSDNRTWPSLKKAMKAKFKKKMSIQMKAQLRKSLKQNQNESVKEFCDRCKEAEQLIFDQQIQDVAFERDLLLTFLIGLREELQLKVMQSEGSSLSDFLQAAIKIENKEDIKVSS